MRSALVFIILVFGYLHSSEAKEQLSLTDFLLDFLLSLWVPPSYIPSENVLQIDDPIFKEHMISVEKSRIALDNFIRHLLRYSQENIYRPYDDRRNQLIQSDDPSADSNNNQELKPDVSVFCKQPTYTCNYPNSDLYPELYSNPELSSNQVAYPNQASSNDERLINPNLIFPPELFSNFVLPPLKEKTSPELEINPNQEIIQNSDQEDLYPGHLHFAEFHPNLNYQNQFVPSHSYLGYFHPGYIHQPYQPQVETDDKNPDQNIISSSTPVLPSLSQPNGEPVNIYSPLTQPAQNDASCDPTVNPIIFYPSKFCPPLQIYPWDLYGGTKRNADPDVLLDVDSLIRRHNLGENSNTGQYNNHIHEPAKRIVYLGRPKETNSMVNSRINYLRTGSKPVAETEIQNPSLISARNFNDAIELDNANKLNAAERALNARLFEKLIIPNSLNDFLVNREIPRAIPDLSDPRYKFSYQKDPWFDVRHRPKKLKEGILIDNLNFDTLNRQLQEQENRSARSGDETTPIVETSTETVDKSKEKKFELTRTLVASANQKAA